MLRFLFPWFLLLAVSFTRADEYDDLRLKWRDQPAAPTVESAGRHRAPAGACTVTSLPPPDEPDLPWGFYLRRIDGAAWLRGYRCWSGHVWAPEDWLVFQRIDPAGGPDPAPTRSTPP